MSEEIKNETDDQISQEKIEISLNSEELFKINKKYKKIKRYMRSSLFAIKTMDGTENYVSTMINEVQENKYDVDSVVSNLIKEENG